MNPSTWSFPGVEGEAGEIFLPEDTTASPPSASAERAPGVVLVGDIFQERAGLISALGARLADKGLVAITAAPSGRGDRFLGRTLREREAEAGRAVTALFERMVAAGTVDIRQLAIVGHGLGGVVAASCAARDARLRAAVLIAAPRSPGAFFPEAARIAWSRQKTARLEDRLVGTVREVDGSLYLEWKSRADELDSARTAARSVPNVLWVHGTADEVVSPDESRSAYFRHPEAGRRARLVLVTGAGHDFGAQGGAGPSASALRGATFVAPALAEAVSGFLGEAFSS
ncbi:prolyl oligopeptidase family serine peptidase [bacterium]|nr:prolyl oligopeptidase family serine peptidase [bacterium]